MNQFVMGLVVGFAAGLAQLVYLIHKRREVKKRINTAKVNLKFWQDLSI
ncbi:MAG: hypothetical protein BWY47_01534 [Bacteroidetes bacterium ADurb.Bin302]|nr:MAG: hypothetical protein BWY47_01534 [Bacteroidetes bacterium ADurb.Bin302]